MKKITNATLILLLVFSSGYSQVLTADELISAMNCKTFNCFKEFVTNKGFSYSNYNTNDNGSRSYNFLSDETYPTDNQEVTSKRIALMTISENDKVISAGFTFSEKWLYNSTMAEFKAKGFKFQKNIDSREALVELYQSASYPDLTLMIVTSQRAINGQNRPAYSFALTK